MSRPVITLEKKLSAATPRTHTVLTMHVVDPSGRCSRLEHANTLYPKPASKFEHSQTSRDSLEGGLSTIRVQVRTFREAVSAFML